MKSKQVVFKQLPYETLQVFCISLVLNLMIMFGFLSSIYAEIGSLIVGFIVAHYLMPVSVKVVSSIKENKGFLGRLYEKYYNGIGKILFLNKRLSPFLQGIEYEYKIYINKNMAVCYCSEILEIRQNIFNQISGKISRAGEDKNSINYFNGSINGDYLRLTESTKKNKNDLYISSMFFLDHFNQNVLGESIEISKRGVVSNIVILSSKSMYNTIDNLIDETPMLKEKLANINFCCRSIKTIYSKSESAK